LRHHDRTKFEIHLFANQPIYDEWYGDEHCHDIQNMTSEEVAELIREMGIDILIDLSGHTEHNRLDVFALRPAPVQMTYLGFPNTTGLTEIQYRITDGIADREDTTQYYSEQLLRLPCCFLCFDALYPRIIPKPKDMRQIVFGSLNKESKISPECLDTWRELLRAIPNAVLLLKFSNKQSDKLRYISHLGNQLEFVEYADNEADYNKLFSQIDVLLDTFPYSGTTTTCKALYNSVPVITLYYPNIHAHNVSASILIHSGLSQYVAYSREEYIQIARRIALDGGRDETIHDKFREAIMNPTRFIQHYEKALFNTITFDGDYFGEC
jgi:predicted O-linked N-acetylglucosamine transferase (SPINDLY family)